MDFFDGEHIAEEVIDAILTAGGNQLYKAYLERKSFPFTVAALSDSLCSELRMCFVRHDDGEPLEEAETWTLEAEPEPNSSDTWARACVPIRKKMVRRDTSTAEEARKRALKKAFVPNSSPSSKPGAGDSGEPTSKQALRGQMIPINEEQEEDEEVAVMREMKEREAKRKRDEEIRLLNKERQEAEQAAQLAQVKDQMKNKPYTYDSEGNIIWIQAVATERLPNASPAVNFSFKKAAQKDGAEQGNDKTSPKAAQLLRANKKRRKEPEFVDGFKRLTSQQPSMMDAMAMAPGVQLSERGRSKKGQGNEGREARKMTREDYNRLVQKGGQFSVQDETSPMFDPGGALDPNMLAAVFEEDPISAKVGEAETFNLGPLSQPELNGVSPPSEPRPPRQPAPPPTVHSRKLKRDAVGYRMGARDRVPTSGTPMANPLRMAPPPIGASMGHGLLPRSSTSKHEEFYFPLSPRSMQGTLPLSEDLDSPLSARSEARHGEIHTQNRPLATRLFQ